MRGNTSFIDPAAVEAWDAWFRWRRDGRIGDFSIDDTWMRVARALASVEALPGVFEKRLVDACASWKLLLDESLLTTAGTEQADWRDDGLVAVVNAAVFVRGRFATGARFDYVAFAETAALAVRALDNAGMLAARRTSRGESAIGVGIIGLADALAFLRVRYGSALGRSIARDIASELARACLHESVRLARERGRCHVAPSISTHLLESDVLGAELEADLDRHGSRHVRVTSITSQPRLALLANNVADAVDPLRGADQAYVVATRDTSRVVSSSGYAMTISRDVANRHSGLHAWQTLAQIPVTEQIEMRAAIQPWMDVPISYPLAVAQMPDARDQRHAALLAAAYGLGAVIWNPPDHGWPVRERPAEGAPAIREKMPVD